MARLDQDRPLQGGLTEVLGLRVGHYTDTVGVTGCTVVICDGGAIAAVDVRGAAPATRETDLLRPENTVQRVDAVLLSGGSAFGLAAADGVVRWLEERGLGFKTRAAVVPIVPAACLYDLGIGAAAQRPRAEHGYSACQAATDGPIEEGSVGAGTGATVGHLLGPSAATKAGVGTASRRTTGGISVGALAVVNAFGDVLDDAGHGVLAGPRTAQGFLRTADHIESLVDRPARLGQHTTLAVVATDARLDRPALLRIAQMAHDGLARSIDPVHTPFDGDAVFALSTGRRDPLDPAIVGTLAATALSESVRRAVRLARGLAGVPAIAELPG